MNSTPCINHPQITSTWECESCKKRFCDSCINKQQVGLIELRTCVECGGRCMAISESGEVDTSMPVSEYSKNKFEETRSFYELLPSAFAYPFAGSGYVLLIIGALMIACLPLIKASGLIGILGSAIVSGYLVAYLIRIAQATASGDEEMPNWPSFSDLWSDVFQPYFMVLGTILVCFLPLIIFVIASTFVPVLPMIVRVAGMGFLLLLGLIYMPAGLMSVAMHDSAEGLNPALVFPAIFKLGANYVLACVVFILMVIIRQVADRLLPVGILPGLISGVIAFYFAIIEFRILGLLYRCNERKLKWFDYLLEE